MEGSGENGLWLAIRVRPTPYQRTHVAFSLGDTTAHLVEDQTRAGQGALVPDLYFSLIFGASDWFCLLGLKQACYGTNTPAPTAHSALV